VSVSGVVDAGSVSAIAGIDEAERALAMDHLYWSGLLHLGTRRLQRAQR